MTSTRNLLTGLTAKTRPHRTNGINQRGFQKIVASFLVSLSFSLVLIHCLHAWLSVDVVSTRARLVCLDHRHNVFMMI